MEHRIITPTKEVCNAAWNNSLPVPLTLGEKVIVDKDQQGHDRKKFIRVKHGPKDNKVYSVFFLENFTTIQGRKLL